MEGLALAVLRPEADASTVHAWVVQDRAEFWGMRDHGVDDVRRIYEFVDSLDTHHAYLLRLDGEPVGVFQTYDPAHDPVGGCYLVEPGDVGIYLLPAPERMRVPGYGAALAYRPVAYLFADPVRRWVVAEPDHRNHKTLDRLARPGFRLGDEIDLPDRWARWRSCPGTHIGYRWAVGTGEAMGKRRTIECHRSEEVLAGRGSGPPHRPGVSESGWESLSPGDASARLSG